MAKKLTIDKLIKDLTKGVVHNVEQVRTGVLSPLESGSLKHTEDMLDSLDASLGESTEGGTSDATAYNPILQALKDGSKNYHLGHSTGVYTQYLTLLRKNYRPELASSTDEQKVAIMRQMQLIDNAIRASMAIDNLDNTAISKLRGEGILTEGKSAKEFDNVLKFLSGSISVNYGIDKTVTTSTKKGKSKIDFSVDVSKNKYITKNLINTLGSQFKQSFTKSSQKGLLAIDTQLFNSFEPTALKGSPSFIDDIDDVLNSAFYGKKYKAKTAQSKVRISRTLPRDILVSARLQKLIKDRTKNLKAKVKARKTKKQFIIPTVTLKSIINRSLAEFIQSKMQVSTAISSPAYLRNQTGRFSESARLLTLNRQQTGAFVGVYTFMTEPYGVFLPGGRLGTPGRNPMRYIEGSIRDIAMQTLKKQFKGIALELK